MSLLRQQQHQEINLRHSLSDVFQAFETAGAHVGKVKHSLRSMGTMTIAMPMEIYPPTNPSTVRLSFQESGPGATKVLLNADSLDGAAGLGSAGSAIDSILAAVDAVLNGRPMKAKTSSVKFLLVTACIVAVSVAVLLYLIR